MTSVADPRDRRFRRVLVKPGRKRSVWRSRVVRTVGYGSLAVLVAYGAYRGAPLVAGSGALKVDRILVRGNEQLSTGEVLEALAGLRGESIVWTDLESWRARLRAVPWIQDAALKRYLPSTIDVQITERTPMAIARTNGELYLVDSEGGIIDAFGPQYANFDLPIVDGLLSAGEAVQASQDGRLELASRVIGALQQEPEIGSRLSQIDVSDPQNATVILSGDPAVIYVGRERFLPRLQSYLQLVGTLRERVARIDYVDLRFENSVLVGPKDGRGRGQAIRAAVKNADGSIRR